MARELITTDRVARPRVPIANAARVGNLVFVSGTVGFRPDGSVAAGGFPAQMRQTMDNLAAVLEAAGSSLDRLVKVNVILTAMENFGAMNEIYRTYFRDGEYPPRTTIEARLARPDLLVEIEAVAEA